MVKDHSDRERGNPLRTTTWTTRLAARDSTYHDLGYTSCVALVRTGVGNYSDYCRIKFKIKIISLNLIKFTTNYCL